MYALYIRIFKLYFLESIPVYFEFAIERTRSKLLTSLNKIV